MAQLDRITRDPTVMGGKPCIRAMRVTVGMIVGQIGAGHAIEELLGPLEALIKSPVRGLGRVRESCTATHSPIIPLR